MTHELATLSTYEDSSPRYDGTPTVHTLQYQLRLLALHLTRDAHGKAAADLYHDQEGDPSPSQAEDTLPTLHHQAPTHTLR